MFDTESVAATANEMAAACEYIPQMISESSGQSATGTGRLYISKADSASSVFYVEKSDPPVKLDKAVVEKISDIRSAYGFNLSQLAKVLGVSRPQLYKWISGEVAPQSEEANYRISELSNFLVTIPEEHAKYFGQFSRKYLASKVTLLDYLADNATEESLLTAYKSILDDIKSYQRQVS